MQRKHPITGSLISTVILGLFTVVLVICIIYFPGEAFAASGQGLTLWWRIVFPGLLPFLVLSHMLIAGGFVHALGTLLDPLIRRILGLPGSLGWVLPLGMIAGFPSAAEAAASLYKQGKITRSEAERMAGIAHFASPMLIVVVVGAGFAGRPELGLLLLLMHWAGGLAAGLTLHAFYPKSKSRTSSPLIPSNPSIQTNIDSAKTKAKPSLFKQALRRMEAVRTEDGRSFGKLLGDSITASVQTLMMIGGYMLIFAVIIQLISQAVPERLLSIPLAGLFEIHLGSYSTAQSALPPAIEAAILGALLGWSGLCAYLQVRAVLGPAGISGKGFVFIRVLHGTYAYLLTLILWKPLTHLLPKTLPAFGAQGSAPIKTMPDTFPFPIPNFSQTIQSFPWSFALLLTFITIMLFIRWIWRPQHKH